MLAAAAVMIAVGVRTLFLGGLLGLFGVILFRAIIAPACWREVSPAQETLIRARLQALAALCVWITVGTGTLLLALDARTQFRPRGLAGSIAAFIYRSIETNGGVRSLCQILLAILAGVAFGTGAGVGRRLLAIGAAGLALALEAGRDHAPTPAVLLTAVHVIAAALWVGMLPAFFILFRTVPNGLAPASRRAAALGQGAIVVLLISGVLDGLFRSGGLAGILGTGFGRLLLVKGSLFSVLAAISILFWARLAPALDGVPANRSTGRVRIALRSQAILVIGLLLASAAASLAGHSGLAEPIWPFSTRISLRAALHEPTARPGLLLSMTLFGASLLALAGALQSVRWRMLAGGGAALLAILALPGLGGLFVRAYPTSYYRSPTGYTTRSVADGLALHDVQCAGCHGLNGKGDGPLVAAMLFRPHDYGALRVAEKPDGDLYWAISHGGGAPGRAAGYVGLRRPIEACRDLGAHRRGALPRGISQWRSAGLCDGLPRAAGSPSTVATWRANRRRRVGGGRCRCACAGSKPHRSS